MDHVEIIQALITGDVLHIRDNAEAQRTGRPAEAVLQRGGRVPMNHALRAVQNPRVVVEPQTKPCDAPTDWMPDGVCFVAS
ncbi:hypothetical protein [Phaeobacter phage MD18]|nr:hypothetical protein [Phaeobacter phage MD18]